MARRRAPDEPPPESASIPGTEREVLSNWMRERLELIERDHQERVELLRTVGEHPSPVFARIIHNHGIFGTPKKILAKLLGIAASVIENYYDDDYDRGAAEATSAVAGNMFRIATSTTDPQAAKVGMDWLNRRGGDEWSPATKKIEIEDKRNSNVIDSSSFTREEREQMRKMIERIKSGGEGEPPDDDEGIIE